MISNYYQAWEDNTLIQTLFEETQEIQRSFHIVTVLLKWKLLQKKWGYFHSFFYAYITFFFAGVENENFHQNGENKKF